jgi:hypothetical protein
VYVWHLLSVCAKTWRECQKKRVKTHFSRALPAASNAASKACQQQVKQRASSHSAPRFAASKADQQQVKHQVKQQVKQRASSHCATRFPLWVKTYFKLSWDSLKYTHAIHTRTRTRTRTRTPIQTRTRTRHKHRHTRTQSQTQTQTQPQTHIDFLVMLLLFFTTTHMEEQRFLPLTQRVCVSKK